MGPSQLQTIRLPAHRDVVAPDGSDVRILLAGERGSLAHFELAAGETSIAVRHRTVEEMWFFLSGRGQMWRRRGSEELVVAVEEGVALVIPPHTSFQFRTIGTAPLA